MTKRGGPAGIITDAPAHRDKTGGAKGVARRVISLPPVFASAAHETAEAQPRQPMAAGTRRRCAHCGVTNFTRSTEPNAGDCPDTRASACQRRQRENLRDGLAADGSAPPEWDTVLESGSVITHQPEEVITMSQKTVILADMRENLAPQRPWGGTSGVLGTSGDIAKRTGISQHDVTHALYDMQKQGLLTFKPTGKRFSPGDGKGVLTHLRLTQKGLVEPLANGETRYVSEAAIAILPEGARVVSGPVQDVAGYLDDVAVGREAQMNTVLARRAALEEARASVALDGETQSVDPLRDEGHEYEPLDMPAPPLLTVEEAREVEEAAATPEPLPSPFPIADELIYERVIDLGAVNEGLIAKLAALEGGDLEGRFPILHELVTREANARKTQEAAYLLRLAGQNTLADMALEAGRVTFEPWEQEVVELLLLLGSEHDDA